MQNRFSLLTNDLWSEILKNFTPAALSQFSITSHAHNAVVAWHANTMNHFYYAVGSPVDLYKFNYSFIEWFFSGPYQMSVIAKLEHTPDDEEIAQSLIQNQHVCLFRKLGEAYSYAQNIKKWEYEKTYDYNFLLAQPAVFVVSLERPFLLRSQKNKLTGQCLETPDFNLRKIHFVQFNTNNQFRLFAVAAKNKSYPDIFLIWWNKLIRKGLQWLDNFLSEELVLFFATYKQTSFFSNRHCQSQVDVILSYLESKPKTAEIITFLMNKREEAQTLALNSQGHYCKMLDFIIGKLLDLNEMHIHLSNTNVYLANKGKFPN